MSVLIPSRNRPERLERCLCSLASQSYPPQEVIVVWQADDFPTRDRATACAASLPLKLCVLHSPEAGVVPAENAALAMATGDLIALIDDDAEAPPDWLARHVLHFSDPKVGAVGGPAINYHPDGTAFPIHRVEPIGRFTWYGQPIGNMYDHPQDWRDRPPAEVDHLVGYNLVLRRTAFDRFESGLRRYWQLFELDACLQVREAGFRVVFDFANVVSHHPTNTAYVGGRSGDLEIAIYNAAYNHAFILGKHSPFHLVPIRAFLQLAVGRVNAPGLVAFVVACRRYGHLGRECGILWRTWRAVLVGWWVGIRRRSA